MIGYSGHALRRMRERGVTKSEIENAILHPLAVRETRYGRKVACGGPDAGMKYTVVISEQSGEDFIVVTSLKVDKERLQRYGFAGI
jgi:hypothetical protein